MEPSEGDEGRRGEDFVASPLASPGEGSDLPLGDEAFAGTSKREPASGGDAGELPTFPQASSVVLTSIGSSAQMIPAVGLLVDFAVDVRTFEEAEITKRVGIAADRDVAIANVKAQQVLIADYLERSFDERAENFKKLFTVVGEASAAEKMQALAMGLESVVELATSSPFKDLRTVEETSAALTDPNHEWDF